MEKVFTFWEGRMPEYIKMCLESWKFDYIIVLNYENLHHYTEFDIEKAKRFTMPQIAVCVRVHALRDNGGYWLDADTIMIGDKLPEENMVGDPIKRTNTIGFLHTKVHSDMFEKWAEYQDDVIKNSSGWNWDIVGNAFTDPYVKEHKEITIYPVSDLWPETYMVAAGDNRRVAYQQFYFDRQYKLSDIHKTDMLMLHNSWTPGWYKELTREEVILCDCTLSNILCEVI